MRNDAYWDLVSKLPDENKRLFSGIKIGMEQGLRIMNESLDELISAQILPSFSDILIDIKDKMTELYICKQLEQERYELKILSDKEE